MIVDKKHIGIAGNTIGSWGTETECGESFTVDVERSPPAVDKLAEFGLDYGNKKLIDGHYENHQLIATFCLFLFLGWCACSDLLILQTSSMLDDCLLPQPIRAPQKFFKPKNF
jgi:hypothetical protein